MSKRSQMLGQTVRTALFAAIISVSTLIPPLPVGALPITMQTLAIYMTAGMLGAKWGSVSLALYIALGALGLPLFTGGQGGIGVLLGATGGYIIGFFAITVTVGLFIKGFGRKLWALIVGMAIGTLVCYGFGTAWFMLVYTQSSGSITLGGALAVCVLPFLLPDALKMVLAALLVRRLSRRL